MSNATVRILIGSACVMAGSALIYESQTGSRKRSLSRQASQEADTLKHQAGQRAGQIRESIADRLMDAVDAGKSAYQHIADQIVDHVAG